LEYQRTGLGINSPTPEILRKYFTGGFAVTDCTIEAIAVTRFKRRKVVTDFGGG
jgi:hypothetical protein